MPAHVHRGTAWALGVALVVAAGLVLAAWTAPVYRSVAVSSSSDGLETVARSSETLVGMEGASVLIPVSIPLVVACGVAGVLIRRRARGLPRAGMAAWLLSWLLGAFSLVAMMSIGVFVLPVVVALLVACATADRARAAM